MTAARKLMIVPIPRRRRHGPDMRPVRYSTAIPITTTVSSGGGRRDPLVADAVLDESDVHAVQRASAPDCPDLVCLSADVRVGPLAPGACATAELRFVALKEGVVGLEAVRVVDLGSQEHVDVRELPLVVVKK
jgi:hypothetical protein